MPADENRKGRAVLGVEMCLQTGTTLSSDVDRMLFLGALEVILGEDIDGCGGCETGWIYGCSQEIERWIEDREPDWT